MPNKRKHPSSSDATYTQKKQRQHGPHLDQSYGQRSAFPGLDDASSDYPLDPLSADALAYLRNVSPPEQAPPSPQTLQAGASTYAQPLTKLPAHRSEASSIPHVLRAPPTHPANGTSATSTHDELYAAYTGNGDPHAKTRGEEEEEDDDADDDDPRGYYSDGAYVAYPHQPPHPPTWFLDPNDPNDYDDHNPSIESETTLHLIPARSAYHAALLARYRAHRATLRRRPPASAIAALDTSLHPTGPEPGRALARKEARRWGRLVRETEPRAAQLAGMEEGFVVWLVGVVAAVVGREGRSRAERSRVGAWVWGLLGRLRGVEEMGGEEVAVIRGLGKRAAELVRGVVEGRGGMKRDELEDGGEDEGEEEGEEEEGEEEEGGKEEEEIHEEGINDFGVEIPSNDDQDIHPQLLQPEHRPETSTVNPRPRTQHHRPRTLRRNSSSSIDNTPAPPECGNAQTGSSDPSHPLPPLETDTVKQAAVAEAEAEAEAGKDAPSPSNTPDAAAKPSLLPQHTDADEADSDKATTGRREGEREKEELLCLLYVILTVVGECYGQRDLLGWREGLWEGGGLGS